MATGKTEKTVGMLVAAATAALARLEFRKTDTIVRKNLAAALAPFTGPDMRQWHDALRAQGIIPEDAAAGESAHYAGSRAHGRKRDRSSILDDPGEPISAKDAASDKS